jgi:hypothetical protein
MVMMMVMMMMAVGVGRNHRTGQNDKRNGSKEQCAQFHEQTPFQAATLSSGL